MPGGKRILCLFSFVPLFAMALPCSSQNGEITTRTKATSDGIEKWLDSHDPRLVAWGAYFAGKNEDDSATAAMLELVDEWAIDDRDGNSASQLNSDTMAEILDALIQRNSVVPPENLLRLANSFPAQTAILAARLSSDEAKPLLETWYGQRKSVKRAELARIAAMMLAKALPTGFAASVLAEANERITISVVDPGAGAGRGGSVSTGCHLFARHEGWPPIFQYAIVENARDTRMPVLVEGGGDKLSYRRGERARSALEIRPLTIETRYDLLLEMLGGDRSALQWKPDDYRTWEWHGTGNFRTDLEDLIRTESEKLRETASSFLDKGLLTADEAGNSVPQLLVVFDDDREDKIPELPQFAPSDPRVMVFIPNQEFDRVELH